MNRDKLTAWKTLYLKELKEQRTVFVFLIALTAVAGIAGVAGITQSSESSTISATIDGVQHEFDYHWSAHSMWVFAPFFTILLLPFLLTHSFAQEFKGQSHFLLLSLPISRGFVFLGKVAAQVTLAIAVYVLATAAIHVWYLRLVELLRAYDVTGASIAPRHLWFLIGEGYFSTVFMFLGIASGIAGLRLVFRRFQGLMAAIFFGMVVYAYIRLLGWVRPPLRSLFGEYRIPITHESGEEVLASARLDLAVYSILFGIALIALGAWVFARRAEA